MKRLIACKQFRIGFQRLLYDTETGEYTMVLTNHSYSSAVVIPQEHVDRWKKALE